jgi:hypothetical protein
MRDRKDLPELRSPQNSFYLFVEGSVRIDVEAEQIITHKNLGRLIRRAHIYVRRGP